MKPYDVMWRIGPHKSFAVILNEQICFVPCADDGELPHRCLHLFVREMVPPRRRRIRPRVILRVFSLTVIVSTWRLLCLWDCTPHPRQVELMLFNLLWSLICRLKGRSNREKLVKVGLGCHLLKCIRRMLPEANGTSILEPRLPKSLRRTSRTPNANCPTPTASTRATRKRFYKEHKGKHQQH